MSSLQNHLFKLCAHLCINTQNEIDVHYVYLRQHYDGNVSRFHVNKQRADTGPTWALPGTRETTN